MTKLFVLPSQVAVNSAGTPHASAKAQFYLTGTTTATDTYSDALLTSANANPVVADSAGQFGAIYLDPAVTYKLTLQTQSDDLIYTEDPLDSGGGALYAGTTTKTTSYTILASDNGELFTQASGVVAFTLPDAATVGNGFKVSFLGVIDDTASQINLTVTRAGSDTITTDGTGTVTSFGLAPGGTATVISNGSNWLAIVAGQSGSFTGTITGYAASLTPTIFWRKTAGWVTLSLYSNTTGTSNATTMTMTGLPAAVTPANQDTEVLCILHDNGADVHGFATIDQSANTISFGIFPGIGGFTASAAKGLPGDGWTMSYPLF